MSRIREQERLEAAKQRESLGLPPLPTAKSDESDDSDNSSSEDDEVDNGPDTNKADKQQEQAKKRLVIVLKVKDDLSKKVWEDALLIILI